MRQLRPFLALVPALAFLGACGGDDKPDPQGPAPRNTSSAVAAATAGEAYRYTVTVTGEPSPTLVATRAPSWLTLEGRILSGTPAESDVGTHDVTLTASNGVSPNAVQSFTITVSAASTETAPRITSTPVTSAVADVAYRYAVTATGAPQPTLAATGAEGAALPGWLRFAGGALEGTPTRNDVGEYAVVITATNGVSPDAVQSFTIAVTADGVAPSFTSTPVTQATEGAAYSYTVAAAGTPAPTVAATEIPAWLTFAGGVLSGTPDADDVGVHTVVLTASNGIEPDAVQTFDITVIADDRTAPAFTSEPVLEATEGAAYSYTIAVTGTPAPTVTAAQLPSWLSLAAGVLSGTPAAADVGTHAIELTASNGVQPDATQSFTITVVAAATAPAITSTPVTDAVAGLLYTYEVTASGSPAPTLSAAGAAGAPLPAWLAFDAATGTLSGIPGALDVGSVDLEITATNGIQPDAVQSFTLVITPAPVAPSITSTPVTSATEGQLYSYTITAAGEPAPSLAVTAAAGGALPAWLTFTATTGVLAGTPGVADVGTLDVLVTASNGVQPDATQSFTITVAAGGIAPSFTSTPPVDATVGVLYTYTVVADGTPAPAIAVAGLPAWLTFAAGTNTISGTPGQADVGTTGNITVTATGYGTPAEQIFTITVSPPPVIAIAGSPYIQDFGTAAPVGWSANGVWEFGIPTTGANTVGPPSLFDGAVAATNLTGNYGNSAFYNLRTPTFDLTGATDPVLRFAHWYNLEGSATATRWDGANIKISTDGGATWSELAPASVTPAYTGALSGSTTQMAAQLGWSGILPDWQLVTVDLAANLAGQPLNQVVLRFDVGTDSSGVRPGWYIDRVVVAETTALQTPPAITSAPPAELQISAGRLFTHTVTAVGAPAPTLSATGASGAALPAWLSFDAATGVLSGTPANGDAGTVEVVITASNGEPRDAVQTFTLTVIPVVALAAYNFEGDVRTPSSVAANATAGPLDNRDGNATFVAGNPGRAITTNGFNNAANPNYFQFTVTASAGYQLVLQNLVFDTYRSGTGPTDYQVSVLSGGVETLLAGGAGTIAAATTWTPANIAFAGAEAGPYTGPVTIRITGSGTTNAAGTLRLDNVAAQGLVQTRVNSAPVLLNSPPTEAQVGVLYSHTIAVDGWPAPTLTVTGRPAWLAFDAATRTLSGTPGAFNSGTTGNIVITASNGVTPAATETFTITVAPAAVTPQPVVTGSPVIEGFGAAIPTGWAANGDWQFGTPTTGAATVGPPSLFDGEVAATNLTGNYSNSTRSTLQSPVYDLSGLAAPSLRFVHWHNFERSTTGINYDGANVKISTDGGLTWNELLPASVTPAYTGALAASNAMGAQLAWSGTLTDWTQVTIDLAANLAGQPANQVVLRLEAGSDSSVVLPGWYIDDLRIGDASDFATAPEITSLPQPSGMEGVAYSYQVTATGLPAPTLAATGPAGAPLPAWLTFDAATRTLAGTPGAGDAGTVNVEITATNAAGVDTQAFSLVIFAAGTPPVFSDDFEGDPTASEWVIGFDVGTASEWAIGVPTVVGPATAASGSQCAGTTLDDDYAEEIRLSYLQSPVLNLEGLPAPTLRFRHWRFIESTYDGGNVKISTDGGLTFAPLTPEAVSPAYSGVINSSYGNPMGGQRAWWGASTTWTTANVNLALDLEGLPRDQVVIRFEFAQDDEFSYDGWYIDDVAIGDVATLP